jgi:dimethylglycine catabolism A
MTSAMPQQTIAAGTGAGRYPHVFRPLQLGPATLRNRIFVPAHTTNYGEDNLPTDRHLAYHRARAAGGAGMIVFEGIRVHRSSLGRQQGVNGYEPACIPRFSAIARGVQAEGARLFGQIIHLGRHIDGNYARMAAWSSSAVPWSALAPPPHPMTQAEIAEVVAAHAQVARHLEAAGLDGLEVTLAHGHLLQQFLSPAVNRRQDGYGGSLENRLRMTLETLQAVRDAVGHRLAVGVRISADEFLPDGLHLADMQQVVTQLCAAVELDFVNVSHSAYHGSATISTQMADMAFARDAFHALPRGIAAALRDAGHDVPVFAVCRFRSVAEAEEMLAEGDIAMVGMARAHIADAALVRKAAEGREIETRPCIACNQGCAGFLALSLPITCLANAATGREAEWPLPLPAMSERHRRIVVIGGGPAGMEAALTAAGRRHEVVLWEAQNLPGGALRWATTMPKRRDFGLLLDYQRGAAERAGVVMHFGKRVTAEDVLACGADAVVIATGAKAMAAALPDALTMEQALAAPDVLGPCIAVQDTLGSWAIAGFVEWLADSGRQVMLIVPGGTPGWQVNIYSGYAWRQRLRERSVRILPLKTVTDFAEGVLTVQDLTSGAIERISGIDTLVAPTHALPDDSLINELQSATSGRNAPQIVAVGDCVAARSALEAVFEGHQAGRTL